MCSRVSRTVAQHSVTDYLDVVKVKKATDSIKAFVKDWDTHSYSYWVAVQSDYNILGIKCVSYSAEGSFLFFLHQSQKVNPPWDI